jgi:hypothetical protein
VGDIFPYGMAVGLLLSVFSAEAGAQLFDVLRPPGDISAPRPPGEVPGVVPAPQAPTQSLAPPSSTGSIPRGPSLQSLPPAASPGPSTSPSLPSGQVALAVSARFGRDLPAITGGLHWRIYPARPEQGAFRPVKEDRGATPTFALPAGSYVVHVGFGLASVTKAVQLRAGEPLREVFEISAGGLRIEGRVGDARIPHGQISFDLFKGSQFEPGDKRPIVQAAQTGDVILVPDGTYHIVSNYGDGNSVVRSDIRVQVGKLTDATVTHRAAIMTLKLVNDYGGEARANTQWTVLTPGGDVIKDASGAFPRVILAEGEYRAIARNDGRMYERPFRVVTGVDVEVEVLAR